MSGNKGFSIIELIMVMSIMFILTAMAISYMQPYPILRVANAARAFASDIKYAHDLAVTGRQTHGISIDPSSESYFLYQNTTSNKVASPITGGDMLMDYANTSHFKEVDLLSTNFGYHLKFNSKGEPCDEYGNLLSTEAVITLSHASGFSTTVRVEPQTGKVRIQ